MVKIFPGKLLYISLNIVLFFFAEKHCLYAQITEYIPESDTARKSNLYAVDTINYIVPDEIIVGDYIEKYKYIAILEMKRSGIPASITLAQGIMESRHGNSRLARKANNHFGVKCRSEWHGKRAIHTDEQKNECFRAYNSPIQSFIDHSNFLAVSPRYAVLFLLSVCDYKGWAQGLEELGYSTSGHYAEKLTSLIESHQLQIFDRADVINTADSAQAITLLPTEACYRKSLLQVTRPKKMRNKQELCAQGIAAIEQLHQFHRFGDIYQNVAPSRDSLLAILAAARAPVSLTALSPDTATAIVPVNEGGMQLSLIKNTLILNAETAINPLQNRPNFIEKSTAASIEPIAIQPPQAQLPLMFTYKAIAGDTLENIARQFKVSPDRIREANPNIHESTIPVGEKIKIPAD